MKSIETRLNAIEVIRSRRNAMVARLSKAERDARVKHALKSGDKETALREAEGPPPKGIVASPEQRKAAVKAAFA